MKSINFKLTPAKLAVAIASVLACSTSQASTSFDDATQTHILKDEGGEDAVHFGFGNQAPTSQALKNGQNIKFLNTSSRWFLVDFPKDFSYELDKVSFTNKPSEGAHGVGCEIWI